MQQIKKDFKALNLSRMNTKKVFLRHFLGKFGLIKYKV